LSKLNQRPLFNNSKFKLCEESKSDFFLRYYSVDTPHRINLMFEISKGGLSFWIDRTAEIPEWSIGQIEKNKSDIESEILDLFKSPIQVDRQGNKITIRILDQGGQEIRNYKFYRGLGIPWLHKKERETFKPYFEG
ncbi:MAG: hypothetical protein AAF740_00150, partial [Bacteroidota bacterium]